MILIYRLQDSRIGRSWMAIREDELAAAASGLNTVTTKLLAFALGASTAGFAGVFNASKLTLVSPDQFLSTVSFSILAMVVLGGMGNIWGVALGAFIVYTIQVVLLKQLNTFFAALQVPILKDLNFVQYQFLLYGIALVLMMLFRPEGLFPSQTPQAGAPCRPMTSSRDGPDRRAGARRDASSTDDGRRRREGGDRCSSAEHITKRFGGLLAINDISFDIPRGLDRQPDRAERRRQDDVLQHHRRDLRPDQRVGSRSSGRKMIAHSVRGLARAVRVGHRRRSSSAS